MFTPLTRSIPFRHLAFCAAALTSSAIAAPDSVDTVFATSAGQVFQANASGGVSSVLVQPDGKILFGSNEMPGTVGGNPLQMPLVRFDPDGTVDNTFFADNEATGSDSGIYYDGIGWPEVHALGLQSDGKIIAAGVMQGVRIGPRSSPTVQFTSANIARFNPDGTLDTTFQTNGTRAWPTGGLDYIEELTIAPDDKIIAVGGFSGFRNSFGTAYTTRYGIARLNPDGSLDTTFQINPADFAVPAGAALPRGFFRQASLDSAGRIYIVGSFEWDFGFPAPSVHVCARLFPDGSRDFAFNPSLPSGLDGLTGIVVEPDDNVVVLGRLASPATTSWMVRLSQDGTRLPSFTLDPSLGIVSARPLQRDASGRYLLAENTSTTTAQDRLVRVGSNGSLDPSFSATSFYANHPTSTPQAGYFGNFTTAPSGKIYSGSAFDSVNSVSTVKVVAFDGDPLPATLAWSATAPSVAENAGTLRLGVTRSGPVASAASVSVTTSPGSASALDFTAFSGTLTWSAGLAGQRFIDIPIAQDALAEGAETFTLTLSSAAGASVTGPATVTVTIVDDEDPPVIVTHPSSLAVRDGEPASFSVVVSSPVPATYQWKKGTVEIPGATTAFFGIPATSASDAADYSVVVSTPGSGSVESNLATLTIIPPVAAVDPAFTPATGITPVAFALLTDGSLVVFEGTFNGGYTLVKLTSNGTRDTAFNPVFTTMAGSNNPNLQLAALPNGQFLVGGFFTHINGIPRPQLALLNADGTVDESFDANLPTTNSAGLRGFGVTADGEIFAMVLTSGQGSKLVRIGPTGTADPTFLTTLNYGTSGNLSAIAKLPDGSYLISYVSNSGSFTRGIRRLSPDGTLFPGFAHSTSLFPQATSIAPLPGGRFAIARGTILEIYSLLGTLQQSFSFTGTLTSVTYHRGRLIVAGPTGYAGTPLKGLARLSLDGLLDDNFPGGSGPNNTVSAIAIDAEDRLVAVGGFTAWNGTSLNRLSRLLLESPELAFASPFSTASETGGPLEIELARYGDSSAPASVRVTSTPGSATSPDDFTAVDQVVSWDAGDASPKSVTVSLADDATVDGDLSFTLDLSEPTGAAAVPGTHTVTIRDDESMPQNHHPARREPRPRRKTSVVHRGRDQPHQPPLPVVSRIRSHPRLRHRLLLDPLRQPGRRGHLHRGGQQRLRIRHQ